MRAGVPFPVDAVLLLGPTGSGKSPLGDLLAQRGFLGRTAHHLDFGSSLRSAASETSSRYTVPEQAFLRSVLEQGVLLENEHFVLARKVIIHALERCGFAEGEVLVLNGIPRHVGQAQDMTSIASVHAVVILECDSDAVSCRLQKNVGGDRAGRQDDRPELVRKKLEVFHDRTRPLIDHYDRCGAAIYRLIISDRMTGEDAFRELSCLAAGDPPVSLVAEPPER